MLQKMLKDYDINVSTESSIYNKLTQDYYQNCILQVEKYFSLIGCQEETRKMLVDLFSENTHRGSFMECMGYYWLLKHQITFMPQVQIAKKNCFKKHDYYADGVIGSQIYFDIKNFGITIPNFEILQEKIAKFFPDDVVVIESSYGIENKELEAFALSRIKNIIEKLEKIKNSNKSPKTKLYLENGTITIKLVKKTKLYDEGWSEYIFEPYEWAQNNEFYFMHDASQCTRKNPYVIICTFDEEAFLLHDNSYNSSFIAFRALCRRIFMRLTKIKDVRLNKYDKKALDKPTIGQVARHISAIIFIDVSKEKAGEKKTDSWIYYNPNATHRIDYEPLLWLNDSNVYYENFIYDNY